MSLSVAVFESGYETTDTNAYVLPQMTLLPGRLYVLAVAASPGNADPGTPNLTGGNDWNLDATAYGDGAIDTRTFVWSRLPTINEQLDAFTVTWGMTVLRMIWVILEIQGTPRQRDAAVVQAVTGGGVGATSLTINLAAFRSPNNMALGFFTHHANEAKTVGDGFTKLFDEDGGEATRMMAEWKLNDASVDASWASSVMNAGIAVEIQNSARLSGLQTLTLTQTVIARALRALRLSPASADTLTLTGATADDLTLTPTDYEDTT